MTTTETTTGQLVLDAEQAEEHRLWSCNFTREELAEAQHELDALPPQPPMPKEQIDRAVELAVSAPALTLTLSFDVVPQPEIIDADRFVFKGVMHYTHEGGHRAILRSWWQGPTSEDGMGNTGSPRAGQRVRLMEPESRRRGKRLSACLSGLGPGEAMKQFDKPLATATLAAVPRVERTERTYVLDGADGHTERAELQRRNRARFSIKVEVTP